MSQRPAPLTPDFEAYFAANQGVIDALNAAEQARSRVIENLPGGLFLRHVVQAADTPYPYVNSVALNSGRSLVMPPDLVGLTLFAAVNDNAIRLTPPSINGRNEILVVPSVPTPDKRKKITLQSAPVFAIGLGGSALASASWVSQKEAYDELLGNPDSIFDPRIAHQLVVADI